MHHPLKRYTVLLFVLVIAFGCQEKQHGKPTDLQPKYTDFENSWEERNLFGKVKELVFYKKVYQNAQKEGTETLAFKETFTDFGAIQEIYGYGMDGALVQKDVFEYNEEKEHIKTVSTNTPAKNHFLLNVMRDSLQNSVLTKMVINDTFQQQFEVFYNDKKLPSKRIEIEQNDTTVIEVGYELNANDKILSEWQIDQNSQDTVYASKYEYDASGNVTQFSYKMFHSEYITTTDWENGRITTRTQYVVAPDLVKRITESTEFDELFHPVNKKIYRDSELEQEVKYQYSYDEHGNWISREAFMKEHFAGSKKFTPMYLETRKITYWE